MAPLPDKLKIPFFGIRADVKPDSIDESNRTVEIVFGTEAPVRRWSWTGKYQEILSFENGHVDMSRLDSGRAPFLDNHRSSASVADQLGVVERAWIQDNQGHAIVRFAKDEKSEAIYQKVIDGIIRNISVGYQVETYEITENESGPDVYRAINWKPVELSATLVPADAGAHIRSSNGGEKDKDFQLVNIISSPINSRTMADITANNKKPPKGNNKPTGGDNQSRAAENQGGQDTPAAEEQRSEAPAAQPVAPATPATETRNENGGTTERQIQEAAQLAIRNERARVTAINDMCRMAGLPPTFANNLIENNRSVDQARADIFAEWGENGLPATRSHVNARVQGEDERDKFRNGMQDAIMHRAGSLMDDDGNFIREAPENARRFRGLKLVDMARRCLDAISVKHEGLSQREIVQEAFKVRAMGTSDFPLILGNTVNRVLRRAYELQDRTFMPFCRRGVAQDFRDMHRVQLSNMMTGFDEIPEGGEYKASTFTEGQESFRVKKYGKIIPITWELLVNDDLGAFNRIPSAIAAQAAILQNDIVWALITGNPTMDTDGVALFHSTHGNLAASGAAISSTTLSAARKAMRLQKGLNKKDYINVRPSYILVSPERETEAQQLLQAVIVATKTADTNVFRGSLEMIVEPRLDVTNNPWYLVASPMAIDTIEYAFLEGEGELFTEQKVGFEVDGMQIKARTVFGAKVIDHRSFYKNPGA